MKCTDWFHVLWHPISALASYWQMLYITKRHTPFHKTSCPIKHYVFYLFTRSQTPRAIETGVSQDQIISPGHRRVWSVVKTEWWVQKLEKNIHGFRSPLFSGDRHYKTRFQANDGGSRYMIRMEISKIWKNTHFITSHTRSSLVPYVQVPVPARVSICFFLQNTIISGTSFQI